MHVRYSRSLPEGYLMYGCDYEQYDGVLHIPLSSFPRFLLASLHIMSFKSQKCPVHRNMLSHIYPVAVIYSLNPLPTSPAIYLVDGTGTGTGTDTWTETGVLRRSSSLFLALCSLQFSASDVVWAHVIISVAAQSIPIAISSSLFLSLRLALCIQRLNMESEGGGTERTGKE